MKEYVQEFWRVAGRMQQWLERLLVYIFKEGLDHELLNAYVYRGVPDQIR